MNEPLYRRGFPRATYNRLIRHAYQPPISCSHVYVEPVVDLAGIPDMAAVSCCDCGLVVAFKGATGLGPVRPAPEPPRPPLGPEPSPLADYLDRVLTPPRWVARLYDDYLGGL